MRWRWRAAERCQRFLGAYKAITYDLRGLDLEKQVSALEKLPLGQPEVSEARDLCVAGHRAVLAQERLQEANGAEIDRALATSKDGARWMRPPSRA